MSPAAGPDRAALEAAVRALLEAMGPAVAGEDVAATPQRVAELWADELLSGYAVDPVACLAWEPAGESRSLVVVRDIAFTSTCLHHLLPFSGRAAVAYLPGERLCGLSKLVRVVSALSARLQIQERLTVQTLRAVDKALQPRGAAVVMSAVHECMSCRGVRQPGASVVTTAFSGDCEREPLRGEVLSLMTAR